MAANTHSAYFDLNNQDYAYIPGASCPNLQLTEGTCEAWFKCDPAAPDDQWTLCAKYSGGGNINYHFYAEGGSGGIDRIYFVMSTNGSTLRTRSLDISPVIAKNEWHHWAVSRRASDDRTRFYLDGAPLGNFGGTAYPGDMHTSEATFRLGRREPYPYHYTEGWLDEVRVWSTIRTDAEILANYNRQISGSETGLQGYWQLNNDWVDQSPNGYDLTPGAGVLAPTFSTDHPVFPDSAGPTISNMSPTPSGDLAATLAEARNTPIEFDVTDQSGIGLLLITCSYASPEAFVVYDGDSFVYPFDSDTSTVTTITDGYHFRVLPRLGWRDAPSFWVYAVDGVGNLEGALP